MNIFSKVTLRNLRKNRTRTAVTIIGIALSAALFTAVTCSVSTLLNFIRNYMIFNNGSWYGAGYTLSREELDTLAADSEIEELTALQTIGFAALTDCANEYKPYLFVGGIMQNFTDLMPVHLTEGRMPETSSELLLPEHLETNGQLLYEIGDELTLELGNRESGGYRLNNHTPYLGADSDGSLPDDGEALIPTSTQTYTVVGFYKRPKFEDYSAPGYTALTIAGTDDFGSTYDAYFTIKNGFHTSSFLSEHTDLFPGGYSQNSDYLRTMGYSGESNYNNVLFGLAAILIAIILFGSISLIYNAFSISVSERTKQFGMLSSIGATKRQLRRSVLTEGLFLALLGIPLGLVVGLLGIGITFHFVGNMMAAVIGITEISMTFRPSLAALLIAILVSLFTILISAYIPARRATRISAMDAIRQSGDIRIKAKTVKTGRLTQKLFGFEGMIAAKNFKRNRKSYRATVLSLFVSIVLFISANNLCSYLTGATETVYHNMNYDVENYVAYAQYPDAEELDRLMEDLSGLSGVTDISYYYRQYAYAAIEESAVDPDYLDVYSDNASEESFTEAAGDSARIYSSFVFVEDETFRSILKENHISEETYFNSSVPKALCVNSVTLWGEDQRYHRYEPITSLKNANIRIALDEDQYDDNGNYTGTSYTLLPIACDAAISVPEVPTYTGTENSYFLLFYLPYSSIELLKESMEEDSGYDWGNTIYYCIQTGDHAKTLSELDSYMEEHDTNCEWYITYDYAEEMETTRTMIFIINVFSYGFIILITLIAVANVFNTISTNILLRRKEFAMLRSVGMTPKGFRRMMNFECVMYGGKSLLFGLPVSFLITYLIFKVMNQGIQMKFYLSLYSVVIAIGSVFLVVFATMLYSMKKIAGENTVDALKNENA